MKTTIDQNKNMQDNKKQVTSRDYVKNLIIDNKKLLNTAVYTYR